MYVAIYTSYVLLKHSSTYYSIIYLKQKPMIR